MVFAGNYTADSTRNVIRNAFPGWDMQIFRGYARITTTPATSWQVLDENTDQPLVVRAAGWWSFAMAIYRAEFAIERALVGANGDVLKLGVSAADTSVFVVNSTAVASGTLGIQSRSTAPNPSTPAAPAGGLFSDYSPSLFLHNGANAAPAGTLALPANSNPNFLIVPVRFMILRPTPLISSRDLNLSAAAQRSLLG